MKRLMKLFVGVLMSVNAAANAAIINDSTFQQDGFKDSATGLVWMDFGINNSQSYNYVVSQLGDDGIYSGWRLPTANEAYILWANVANLANVDAGYEDPDKYGPGQLYAWDNNSRMVGGDDSVWESTFDVMGFNTIASTDFMQRASGTGFFMGEGGLAVVGFHDALDKSGFANFTYKDELRIRDDGAYSDFYLRLAHENYSTMLVRSASVPEPETIGLFGAAMLVMFRRRLSK